MDTVLTVAVPTYNMEWCLEKNLQTYCSERLAGRVEVLVMDNASTDASAAIAQKFCDRFPGIFRLYRRASRGYGGAVNQALSLARGRYFRIVDADDWVNTAALERLVERLSGCNVDIVQTDYTVVDMRSGGLNPVCFAARGIAYKYVYQDFRCAVCTLPTIHSTVYRTALLRGMEFAMQDETFFVDEEYIVLPFLHAESIVYFPENVYQYQVANPEQSTSPKNRGKYAAHRERVIRRLVSEYCSTLMSGGKFSPYALEYCLKRIQDSAVDHFTTLYIYVENRSQGRRLAAEWAAYLEGTGLPFRYGRKQAVLSVCNALRIGPRPYTWFKECCWNIWRADRTRETL